MPSSSTSASANPSRVTETIGKGGAYIVPSGLVHGVKALEAGKLIDSFTPRRDDFL